MRPLDPRLVPHLAPARVPLAGVVLAGAADGLLLIGQAFAVAGLLARVLEGSPFTGWAWLLLGLTVTRAAVGWAGDRSSARAATVVGVTLRRRVVAAALAVGRGAVDRRSGEVALLATRGVSAIEPYLTRYVPALVTAAVLPAATLVAIATQDLLSAVVVLGTLPLVPVFAALVGLATRDRAEQQWRLLGQLSGHFVDVMRGLPTLVAHRRAEAQSARIREVTHSYRRATQDTLRLAFASSAVLELVATLSVALVAVTVGLRLSSGSLDLQTALVVLLLAPEAYWPLRRVGAEFHAAAEGTATFDDASRFVCGPSGPPRRAGVDESRGWEAVQLDRVVAGYADGQVVLDGLSARIEPRGLTVITGPSGAGKSTLLGLLTGQLTPRSGRLTLGNRPLAPGDLAWDSQVAWVPQRPWLLPGTVRDNVCLGQPGADDSDVWLALERVHLADHVATLPAALDAPVGEDGLRLSAGERARLVLARVVLADRPWVLLDEPTAHLDDETARIVLETLTWLARDHAVVIVAHDPAIVAHADHVVEVPAGRTVRAEVPEPAGRGEARPGSAGDQEASERVSSPPLSGSAAPAQPRGGRAAVATALGVGAAASGVALTATAGWLIARAAEQPPVLMLMVAIVGVRTFGLARPALRYVERLMSHDVALRLLADRRAEVYDALVPLVPGRIGPQRGDVLASLVDDVESLLDARLRVRAPLWTLAGVGAGAVLFSWLVLPRAGLVVLAVVVLGGGLALLSGWSGARRHEQQNLAMRARVSSLVTSTLQGAPELTMWQAEDRALDAIDAAGRTAARAASRSAAGATRGRAAATLAGGAGVVAVALLGRPALESGTLSGPMLALLALLPLALLDVLLPIADAGALAVRTAAAEERLTALQATAPAVADPSVPHARTDRQDVAVSEVGVDRDGSPVLSGVTFDLPPGGRLGVVGPSGCGKSTLGMLVVRFLDPSSGTIRLGGTSLRELALSDVRRAVGLLDDDPHVFSSSVVENVRLARAHATDAEVESALRRARLGCWLDGLPYGLHTMLGDGHAQVSGGERARIGLARALLADQPVLVLDEPTAHLDAATAQAVTDDLLDQPGRSIVWVTHGTVGLDRMDEVLVLGGGAQASMTTGMIIGRRRCLFDTQRPMTRRIVC